MIIPLRSIHTSQAERYVLKQMSEKIAYKRMTVGAIIGLALFLFGTVFLLYMNGWFDISVQQYAGPPPLMSAFLFGFLGTVLGALLGLLRISKLKFFISLPFLIILLFGGILPNLPNSWFDNFPLWFETVILCLGGVFLVLFLAIGFIERNDPH